MNFFASDETERGGETQGDSFNGNEVISSQGSGGGNFGGVQGNNFGAGQVAVPGWWKRNGIILVLVFLLILVLSVGVFLVLSLMKEGAGENLNSIKNGTEKNGGDVVSPNGSPVPVQGVHECEDPEKTQFRDDCYYVFAMRNSDKASCEKIGNNIMREHCIGRFENKPSDCSSFEEVELRDICYFELSLEEGNKEICDSIFDEPLKLNCYLLHQM